MEQNTSQDTPGKSSPPQKDRTPYVDLIAMAGDWLRKRLGVDRPKIDFTPEFVIWASFLICETESWVIAFTKAQRSAAHFYRDPNTYWRVIAIGVSTPEVETQCLELLDDSDVEGFFPGRNSAPPPQEITPRATTTPRPSTRKTPEPNPDLKNLSTYGLVKHYALVRKTSVFNFIVEQSDNLTFAKIHNFIQHNGNYELSSKGKVVYDGSFSWITRELGISPRTVSRAFAWMAPRKLVTKISPQDHRIRKNSRWYVCTSMAQNLKLWSLARSR
jgi:hypothetical protein